MREYTELFVLLMIALERFIRVIKLLKTGGKQANPKEISLMGIIIKNTGSWPLSISFF